MGTNYYAETEPSCDKCGRGGKKIHIGKSSAGWVFSLRVYHYDWSSTADDEFDITSLGAWYEFLEGKRIVDEYGKELSIDELRDRIENREGKSNFKEAYPTGKYHPYTSWADFHSKNHSEPGPKGLLRHRIGCGCIGHGEGTWDYMRKEFT